MNAPVVGQRNMQLTNPFGTSAGMGLSAADLVGICTHARIASAKPLAAWNTLKCRLHTHCAHRHR
jgi:hypothetical protein